MPSWPPTTPNVVIDANAVVSAALKAESVPEQAIHLAKAYCTVCPSADVRDEVGRVLVRPRLSSRILPERITLLLALRRRRVGLSQASA